MQFGIYLALIYLGWQIVGVKKALERQNDLSLVRLTDEQRDELDEMDLSQDEPEEEKV
jgi:hypothetical protein